ncbi:MAG: ATP/GTP-binding protein [Streptomycetales bacterium]
MSRYRRRRVSGPPVRAAGGSERVEEWPDGEWIVRSVTGSATTKSYRCPGCDHEIHPATPHLVAWPAEAGGLDERRHWHPACWRARGRRGRRA